MSMSQEEIEALMNGGGDFSSDDEQDEPQALDVEEQQSSQSDDSTEDSSSDDNFDDILAGIEGITDDSSDDDENFDDILAGIEGISDDSSSKKEESKSAVSSDTKKIEEMIDQNKYPLPVEKEHKVVNQLNEVAADSEQKASQIFDVLSYILDENNEISTFHKKSGDFLTNQIELLNALSSKFPNIEVFKTNLDQANSLNALLKETSSRVDSENMKIFEAMELMQYHDINRQKIERVMAVIKKLNDYLNGIFEDDYARPQVQIAKHISGDSSEVVEAEDLEALINEFAQKDA